MDTGWRSHSCCLEPAPATFSWEEPGHSRSSPFPHCHGPEGPFSLISFYISPRTKIPQKEQEPDPILGWDGTLVVLQQQQYCNGSIASSGKPQSPTTAGSLFRAFCRGPLIQPIPEFKLPPHTTPAWTVPFFAEVRTQSLVKLSSCLPKVWLNKWRQEAESCSAEPKPSPSLLQTDIQYCYNNTDPIHAFC